MGFLKRLLEPEPKPVLAPTVAAQITEIKEETGRHLTTEELLEKLAFLQKAVWKIQKGGIGMFNYQRALNQVFDIVDGIFVVLNEIVKKQGEKT